MKQRHAVGLLRADQLQVANGELVEPHKLLIFNPADGRDMAHLPVLGVFQVLEHGTGGRHSQWEAVDAKALQVFGFEMPGKLFKRIVLPIHPFFQGKRGGMLFVFFFEKGLLRFGINHLRGVEALHELFHLQVGTFRGEKLTGGKIKKRHAGFFFVEIDGGQEVVAAPVQHIVVEGKARRDQLGHSPLHNALHHFGVFQLVANGHPVPCPHQLGQVVVERMVGEAGQLNVGRRAIGPLGQHNVEHLAGSHSVFAKGFVKVAHPEQQKCPGILRFDGIVLLHQRRFLGVLGTHLF